MAVKLERSTPFTLTLIPSTNIPRRAKFMGTETDRLRPSCAHFPEGASLQGRRMQKRLRKNTGLKAAMENRQAQRTKAKLHDPEGKTAWEMWSCGRR